MIASMPSMRLPHVLNNPSKIQLRRISHVYFEHTDLLEFEKFAADFGFAVAHRTESTVYYRGYGADPYVYVATQSRDGKPRFSGTAFLAASSEDFDKATRLPGAETKGLEDAPGGGKLVTVTRPNGTLFHVVYGQVERQIDTTNEPPSKTHIEQGPYNTPFEKKRRGRFQRYRSGPALVHKLGHYGYVCREFDEEFAFYTNNFNFVPSDVLYDPENPEVDVLTFIHLDLGQDYSDHHSLFLARAPADHPGTMLHHSSFEVADFDTQLMGHQYLAKQGWKSVWGVGRHVLGSQIFDYWKDPDGYNIEHYADGDVVNTDIPTQRDVAGPISVWGPELPKEFGIDVPEPT